MSPSAFYAIRCQRRYQTFCEGEDVRKWSPDVLHEAWDPQLQLAEKTFNDLQDSKLLSHSLHEAACGSFRQTELDEQLDSDTDSADELSR